MEGNGIGFFQLQGAACVGSPNGFYWGSMLMAVGVAVGAGTDQEPPGKSRRVVF